MPKQSRQKRTIVSRQHAIVKVTQVQDVVQDGGVFVMGSSVFVGRRNLPLQFGNELLQIGQNGLAFGRNVLVIHSIGTGKLYSLVAVTALLMLHTGFGQFHQKLGGAAVAVVFGKGFRDYYRVCLFLFGNRFAWWWLLS